MRFLFLLFCLLLPNSIFAEVKIEHKLWDAEWTQFIFQELTEQNHPLLQINPVKEDLVQLGCPGFESLTKEDKAKFWIYFFSGLAKAESGFNYKVRAKAPKGGHGNYGLLQLSKRTARELCNLEAKDILIPQKNLGCGLTLMNYQMRGAPNANGKITKKKIVNKIFTSPMFFWGPLRRDDHRGRKIVTNWAKKYNSSITACNS